MLFEIPFAKLSLIEHSDDNGDRPRPLPVISELKKSVALTERKQSPFWDFDVSNTVGNIYCKLRALKI